MYSEFFGLNEKPFSITPDPRYLYMTNRHSDALAHLIYGIRESGGFIQLTGEVGTGKTTLIRSLLEQMPEAAKLAVILNPNLSAIEFLAAICEELDIPLPEQHTRSSLIASLNRYLLQAHSQGIRVVLIVDEAQTLDAELLEQVRLLTNLETTKQKLLADHTDRTARAARIAGASRHASDCATHYRPVSFRSRWRAPKHRPTSAIECGSPARSTMSFRPGALNALCTAFSGGIPRESSTSSPTGRCWPPIRSTRPAFLRASSAARLLKYSAALRRRRWWPYPVIGGLLLLIGIMLLPPLFNDAGNAGDAAVASAADEER